MVTLWIVAVTVLAALASYTLVGLAVRHAATLGMMDVPRPGEVQVRAVPRNGGYGMLAAVWLAVGLAVFARPAEIQAAPGDDWKLLGVMLGSLLIIPLAMVDDRKRLGAAAQFGGQFAIAAVPVAFGLRIESIASPLGSAVQLPVWLGIILTMLWSVLGLSIGGISAFIYLIRRGAVSKAAALIYLVPPVTAAMAWAAFGETLTPVQIAGLVATVCGVWLATGRDAPSKA